MRPVLALCTFALLAACGADGAPQPPSGKAAAKAPGLSITGEASAGVVLGGRGG
jgi:hypothetical protein